MSGSNDDADADADATTLPKETEAALEQFTKCVVKLETALDAFANVERRAMERKLRPLERAEVHLMAARATTTLFGMYLKTLGVDPGRHACAKELKRLDAFEEKIRATRARVGDGDVGASVVGKREMVSLEEAAEKIRRGAGSAEELLKASLVEASKRVASADAEPDAGKKKRGAGSAGKKTPSKKSKNK
jgi:exosome complex protein LRP1